MNEICSVLLNKVRVKILSAARDYCQRIFLPHAASESQSNRDRWLKRMRESAYNEIGWLASIRRTGDAS